MDNETIANILQYRYLLAKRDVDKRSVRGSTGSVYLDSFNATTNATMRERANVLKEVLVDFFHYDFPEVCYCGTEKLRFDESSTDFICTECGWHLTKKGQTGRWK